MVENEDLLITIILAIISILVLVFVFIYLLNKLITKRIWQQFENNLAKIKNYSFDKPEKLQTNHTGIEEFDNLNNVLEQLTERLRNDYLNTKEFAENASHEMQTPLSVMIINLENLLQEKLPKQVTEKLYATYQSSLKLQKLSKNLLLLTKIENHQYNDFQQINLTKLIEKKIVNFEPLLTLRNIEVITNLKGIFTISIDPLMADVLINNLLSNAINHNVKDGKILIVTTDNSFTIENTTNQEILNTDELFKRFTKGKSSVNSNGLGLAIVRSITKVSNLKIAFQQQNKKVKVTLST